MTRTANPPPPTKTDESNDISVKAFTMDDAPGVITIVEWTMCPDGLVYRHLYSPRWMIITDKQFPVDGFRSTEKWQIVAIIDDEIVCVIPGCQVKAYVKCKTPPMTSPNSASIYSFGLSGA